jgi:hypothetical protein
MDIHASNTINKSDVVSEHFDDEVVIINLDSGNYYSVDGLGVDIWKLLEKRVTLNEIIESCMNTYAVSNPEDLHAVVQQFIAELYAEGLIMLDKPVTNQTSRTARSVKEETPVSKRLLLNTERVVLHKYTDMQDFLLVDPIHEVEYTDWPQS